MKDQVETLIQLGKLQKYVRKMKPHRYQRKDDQDRTSEAGDSKPPTREIKTISGGLTASGTQVLEKSTGERNKQRPFVVHEDAKE